MKPSIKIIAAAFTPMDRKGEIVLEKIDQLAHLYSKNGVDGVFIAGTTGECSALTFEEKKQLMIRWAAIDLPGLEKIYMLGGTRLKEIQYLAEMAVDHRMDAVSIVCPYYLKPSGLEELVQFCQIAMQPSTDIPFYYYHIPGMSGDHFSMPAFLEIAARRIPNFAGIKYSSPNIMDFHTCCGYQDGRYEMYWGSDEALLSGLVVGARGGIGSTYNYATPLYRRIIDALADGNMAEAERWQRKAVQMVSLLFKYGGVGAGKAFMKIIGLDCGEFRSPIRTPSDAQIESLTMHLHEIGFFEFCNQL